MATDSTTNQVDEKELLQILRQAGLVMESERQRASADALMATLSLKDLPTRDQVRAALSKLRVPLSEEIIAMWKEG